MPRPRNQKKKKNAPAKKEKKQLPPLPPSKSPSPTPAPATPPPLSILEHVSAQAQAHPLDQLHDLPQPPIHDMLPKSPPEEPEEDPPAPIPPTLMKTPFIYDPGDGPRVKDPRAFLASRFAAPPTLDDAMCAEFAEEAVLQMLCSVLPEETALILWYNKSRRTARICPACQRLYRLGDILPNHLAGEERGQRGAAETRPSPYLAREQELSGLCSPVCFILAAYNYPGAIRSTWGRMAEELDDATWDLLGAAPRANDQGLGMLLKMTRCHDLGLAQIFFPDLADGAGEYVDYGDGDEPEAGEAEVEGSGEGSEETVREVAVGEVRGKDAHMEDGRGALAGEDEVIGRMERLRVDESRDVSG
ncbi:hypothetical protein BC628DRAFT_1356443 [Trametes gibbosa]|nr:hypothetical protein BC628DRAFT_1356443 [Trametes gibbosa]